MAWRLTSEILRDPFSHTVSALRGDKFVPHPAQVATLNVFEAWVNSNRAKGKIPVRLERPWEGKPPRYGAKPATPADDAGRARRRAILATI